MSQSVSYSSNFKSFISRVSPLPLWERVANCVAIGRVRGIKHYQQLMPVCLLRPRKAPQAGFSLLELAIVLLILGMIGGLSLPLLTTQLTRTAFLKTRSNQDYVVNALAAFVEKNRRFPCPAEPHRTGAEFGQAQESCRLEKAKGIIPFKTLGISETYACDGFKRLMTYVVEPELTKRQINPQEEAGGVISIRSENGFPLIPVPKKTEKNPNYIAFILISHGESGVGAYLGKGQTGKIAGSSLSPHKRENSDDNFVFVESSLTDDLLRWESRDQFLKHYVRGGRSP